MSPAPPLRYLDHAATSFPKAPGVAEEAARFLREDAGNAGRGGHRLAQRAADAIDRARRVLAGLLGIGDADRLALGPSTTWALNTALWGVLEPGQRVVVGPEAHNSVLRPLHQLAAARGVVVEEVASDDVLRWDLDDLERRLAAAPTALVAVSHASNLTGAVNDLAEVARLAHAAGARVLVDAAQTVGALPLDVGASEVDLLAFSGHKSLLGPTGTGGLYVAPGVAVTPLLTGGTGSRSEEEAPPAELPRGLEAGTSDAFACSALAVAAGWVRDQTPARLHAQAAALGAALREGLAAIPGVTLHAAAGEHDLPVVSFTLAGWDPQELALLLDHSAGVAVRAGLHCAPRAHRRLGTLAGHGTLRASPGPLQTLEDVEALLGALRALG